MIAYFRGRSKIAKGGGGPSRSLPLLFHFPSFSLPLVGPLKPARGSGKLPRCGPGQSRAEKKFGAL